jgi:type II secretory pathway component PulF
MKSISATLHFIELLSALLKGKTSLVDALHILAQEGIESPVQNSAVALLATMRKGKGLSDSLRIMKKGKVFFEPLYLTLIASAELTGNIDAVLTRIALDLQRKQRAIENVVNILIYPMIIILLAIAGTITIIVKVIAIFISGGLVSNDVVSNATAGIYVAGMVLFLGGAALFAYYFKLFFHDSPEFRIFYLLEFLMRSSVTLSEALSQCILNMGGTKYGSALIKIKKDITSGIPFSTAFSRVNHFSPYVTGWLSVANRQGNICDVCENIKKYYARKDDRAREIAARLIEPAVIVLTGSYVLIIMVTVILPILTFAGGIL